ncbi:amidase [Rhizobium sp. AG855]|uniref:amidase n=1 Tax=Rhizobium sp. AG855 TaxID=2183898 RepID=UPI000E75FD94|nr:amidase [Rhizobium sp. AG855]RKE79339.1 amidase [Rhizobium sp. AG855]
MINRDGQNGSAAETAFASMLALGADRGLTVAIKDCLDVAGHTTRCGSAAYADAAPALSNSAVVDRLLDAGCRIVGKTRLHEIAYGMTGVNAFEGTPVNPRWPDRIPGGSSSGSAVAVAAGSVDFAIGTDTGGSVRQPAICCGVIGFKPTFGRVDRRGAMPAASSLDCIGPLARSMDMIERAMEIIAPDYRVEMLTSTPRMAWLVTDETDDPEMLEAHEALSLAGMVARRVHLAELDAAFRAGMAIIARETLDANRSRLEAGAPFGMDIRLRLEGARAISDAVLAAAEDIRGAFAQSVDDCLSEFDVIVTPALPQAPPLLSEAADPAKVLPLTRYLRPFNLSGHPAIVLPVVTSTGLPSGIQLIARKGADARLCAVARWLCDHHPMFSDLRGES